MSLRSFHLLFIAVSILLAFGFGVWALVQDAAASYRGLGVAALAAGVALVVYGIWFVSKVRSAGEERRRRRAHLRPLVLAVPLFLAGTRDAWACSVCYGDAQGPMIDAARMGVWLLFALVLFLQLLFALFFIVLWRRARKYRQSESALS